MDKRWFPVLAVIITVLIIGGCVAPSNDSSSLDPSLNVTETTVFDPAVWGKAFPKEYKTWLTTQDQRPAKGSVYKRGGAGGKVYDKLSEYPYLAVLYAGWGFGIEYNEPRGHYYMFTDQAEVDKSRLKSGGVCLTCKTPYVKKLFAEQGASLFSMPYNEAAALIPEKNGRIGPTCVDCHNPDNMDLQPIRSAGVEKLRALGKADLNYGDMRSLVCGQCHSSYIIPRDSEMKATGLELPWNAAAWGNLSVESMIAQIEGDPANLEWKQAVTGQKLGFIRHPEYEMYSKGSLHWANSVACAACHMDKITDVDGNVTFSHNVTSPLNDGMRECLECHAGKTPAQLREAVVNIQKISVAEMNTAGYATAVAAKLIERAITADAAGANVDQTALKTAVAAYRQAFYRVVFLAAENSVGFHNPVEAHRIARDAAVYASQAQFLLVSILAGAGVQTPNTAVDLETAKYLDDRGDKKLNFYAELEFKEARAFPDIPLLSYSK